MVGTTPASELREIPLGKTLLLAIVTLSVYYWIQVWRNSHDIQSARADGFSWWKVMFVLGFFTFGVGFIVLYVLNFLQVHKMRTEMAADDTLGIVALVLWFLTGIVGAIIWNIHWNSTVELVQGRVAAKASAAPATA